MAASTVNIADFRCRAQKGRMATAPQHEAENAVGLKLVDLATGSQHETTEIGGEQDSAVLDINSVRGREHVQRLVLRPALISRNRSNLVRFNEPRVTVMKVKPSYAVQSWAEMADDYDHPPAA